MKQLSQSNANATAETKPSNTTNLQISGGMKTHKKKGHNKKHRHHKQSEEIHHKNTEEEQDREDS